MSKVIPGFTMSFQYYLGRGSVHLKAHEQPEKDRPVGTDGLI